MAGRPSSDADASAGDASASGGGGAVPKHVDGNAAGREVAGVEDDGSAGERRRIPLIHLNYSEQVAPRPTFLGDTIALIVINNSGEDRGDCAATPPLP